MCVCLCVYVSVRVCVSVCLCLMKLRDVNVTSSWHVLIFGSATFFVLYFFLNVELKFELLRPTPIKTTVQYR